MCTSRSPAFAVIWKANHIYIGQEIGAVIHSRALTNGPFSRSLSPEIERERRKSRFLDVYCTGPLVQQRGFARCTVHHTFRNLIDDAI